MLGDGAACYGANVAARPESEAYRAYLARVKKIQFTTPEELEKLDEAIRTARREGATPEALAAADSARMRLIEAYQPLVMYLARRTRLLQMHDPLEIVQEGNLALIRAATKYDPDKGAKFSTYAALWVRAFFWIYLRQSGAGSALRSHVGRTLYPTIVRTSRELMQEGCVASSTQIAERLGLDAMIVSQVIAAVYSRHEVSIHLPVRSSYAPGADGPTLALEDTLHNDEPSSEHLAIVREELAVVFRVAREMEAQINERDAAVLHRCILSDKPDTYAQLAREFGVSRERVRQIEARLRKQLIARCRGIAIKPLPKKQAPRRTTPAANEHAAA